MATTAEEIKNSYPLPVYHYEVVIDGMDPIGFKEVSGLKMEYKTITYKDGLSCLQGAKYMPAQMEALKITLKKGIIKSQSQLYDWFNSIRITTVDKKNITISLMDEQGESPVVTWKIKNAFPTKLEAPTFDAEKNEAAIESLELMADEIKVEYA